MFGVANATTINTQGQSPALKFLSERSKTFIMPKSSLPIEEVSEASSEMMDEEVESLKSKEVKSGFR